MTSGRASDASSQSLSVIIAMPRNRERLIPPRSFISPIWMVAIPVYSHMFRMSAAASIAPIYIGKVSPVFVSSIVKMVPTPIARMSWNTASAYIFVWRSCFFSSSTSRLSSSFAAVLSRLCFSISLFPRGPPIRLPKMRPKVAAAVQMVVAPFMFKSSSTGPKAPAVPCPPTIGIEPVHMPISGFKFKSFASPTAVKFCNMISTITSPKNTMSDLPPLFNTLRFA